MISLHKCWVLKNMVFWWNVKKGLRRLNIALDIDKCNRLCKNRNQVLQLFPRGMIFFLTLTWRQILTTWRGGREEACGKKIAQRAVGERAAEPNKRSYFVTASWQRLTHKSVSSRQSAAHALFLHDGLPTGFLSCILWVPICCTLVTFQVSTPIDIS